MPRLKLRYCVIEKPKADFLKHSITFGVSIPLTDDNLKLRDKFELLAAGKESVTVEIESAQLPLKFGGDAELENIVERVADESEHPKRKVESVTLSSGGKSVTLTNDQFERAANDATKPRKVHFTDQPQIKRERARKTRRMDSHPKK